MFSNNWYVIQIAISYFIVIGINAYATDNKFWRNLTEEVNRQLQQQPLKFGTKTSFKLKKPENNLATPIATATTTTQGAPKRLLTMKTTAAAATTTTTTVAAAVAAATTTARNPRHTTTKENLKVRNILRITSTSTPTTSITRSTAAFLPSSLSRYNNFNNYPQQYDLSISKMDKQFQNVSISKSLNDSDVGEKRRENRGRGTITFQITSTTEPSETILKLKRQQTEQITERTLIIPEKTTEKNSRVYSTKSSIYPPITSTLSVKLMDMNKSMEWNGNKNYENISYVNDHYLSDNKENLKSNNNNNKIHINEKKKNNDNNRNIMMKINNNTTNKSSQKFEGTQPQHLTYAAIVTMNETETNLNEVITSKRLRKNNTIMRSSSDWVNEINQNVDGQQTTMPTMATTKTIKTTTTKTIATTRKIASSNNVYVRQTSAFNLFGMDFWQFLNAPFNQILRASSGTTKRPPKKYKSTVSIMGQNFNPPNQINGNKMDEMEQKSKNETIIITEPNNQTTISPINSTIITTVDLKPIKSTDEPFRIAIPSKNHLFSSDPDNVKGRRNTVDNLRNTFNCPRESEVRFQLFPKICEIDDDCKVWNRDELCCDIFGAKSCVTGIPKPLLELSHAPILGIIPRKCPNRPLAELWWDITECETDMDCWPRVCCPDGRKRYCRTSQPELNTIPFSVRRSFNYLSEYLECTPPPPPIFDIHPKVCTSTFDCFPNVCCQEAGLRHCRPPKKSLLTMLANVFNVDFVKRLTKNIVIK